jgi:glycine/D-amino acid oxidase-like deaminating enzyme
MQWLIQQIQAAGGQLQQRTVKELTELTSEGWDVVVNCCGLRSKDLMSDPYCYPIRGQITKVRAPWVTQCVFAAFPGETAYIIPNREWVVLGGTGQIGNWDTNLSLSDADQILERCSQLLPALQQAEVVDQWTGLRPGRVRLRLEVTHTHPPIHSSSSDSGSSSSEGLAAAAGAPGGSSSSSLVVVSNYGHGGSGLTLAWGTAGDAVELVAYQLATQQ